MSSTKKDAAPPGRPSKSGEPPPAWSMRTYVVTFLYRGPNQVTDERVADELQRGHLANMSRLHEEGKLILAGPFRDDGDLRGIGVFEVRPWYSAKGIGIARPDVEDPTA